MANMSDSLVEKVGLYHSILEGGEDVFYAEYNHDVFMDHSDVNVTDTHFFLLDSSIDRDRTSKGAIRLQHEDFELLEKYSKEQFKRKVPISEFLGDTTPVFPLTDADKVSIKTLETLSQKGYYCDRKI